MESKATAVNPSVGRGDRAGAPPGVHRGTDGVSLIARTASEAGGMGGGGNRSWRGVASMCIGTGMGRDAIL
eukprot:CAMPEP_0113321242 /NCGR_PEP_ID=MMETSP0010_2-20120614/14786_1 /TAXON_ID=216773 ORGANISM="Corethron hystrix, Strain 308" /NCGR_SAMPLE_ID=MMETSP0010_2 /ASSEMBLY_ACC=CAM_ASM_000155 /LENGTH=70 /DNA_ID=CAMNT_0000179299 /DNA_START=46 /DNA_END=258 /DNA_ORIENTATION=+ /assembly_acc=CAM_ASM_000155